MTEVLFNLLKEEGYKVEDDTYDDIQQAIKQGNVQLLYCMDRLIGFFCWYVKEKYKVKHIYITHAVVKKGFRWAGSFLKLRKYFRDMYPEIHSYYWFNDKKGKFIYAK
jgi:hypothetical protein